MTENTTSPQATPLTSIGAANRLYDATALIAAISARVVQLADESDEVSDDVRAELTRLLGMALRQVDGVAGDLFSMKLEA